MNGNILVTGGTGRLGTIVCRAFLQQGYKVRILVRPGQRNQKTVGKIDQRFEIFWGDITESESVSRSLDKIDTVVHMAAVLPPITDEQPELTKKINAGGTSNLVNMIKQTGRNIQLIYTSSVAVFGPTPHALEPLSMENNKPDPADFYARSKLEAENIIKASGVDYVNLRLSATPYLIFKLNELKKMFDIPLNNRIEFCHPADVAAAIEKAITIFKSIQGKTLIISGGSGQRMLYKDMIGGILGVIGLPLAPERKFSKEPYCLDWYDTSESEKLLHYQNHDFSDYLSDLKSHFSQRYGRLFVPVMRRIISPVLGKTITRMM